MDEIEIITKIGEGGESEIFIGKYRGKDVTVKKLKKNLENNNQIVEFLKNLNIEIDIFQKFICYEKNKNISLYEYIDGENTFNLLFSNNLSLQEVYKILHVTLYGLKILHSHNIVHCDIKPENLIMEKNGNVKIIDFNMSQFKNNIQRFKIPNDKIDFYCLGTPIYTAPEILKNNLILDENVDYWSLGITFYIYLSRETPYEGIDFYNVHKKILTLYIKINKMDLINLGNLQKEEIKILKILLNKKPNKRKRINSYVKFLHE
jgi:serine/threonine protein kinase